MFRIPVQTKKFPSSQERSDRLWGPLSLPFNVYRGTLQGDTAATSSLPWSVDRGKLTSTQAPSQQQPSLLMAVENWFMFLQCGAAVKVWEEGEMTSFKRSRMIQVTTGEWWGRCPLMASCLTIMRHEPTFCIKGCQDLMECNVVSETPAAWSCTVHNYTSIKHISAVSAERLKTTYIQNKCKYVYFESGEYFNCGTVGYDTVQYGRCEMLSGSRLFLSSRWKFYRNLNARRLGTPKRR